MIVPNARFNCAGTITSFVVSMKGQISGTGVPLVQVWRPTSRNSRSYNKISEMQLTGGIYITIGNNIGYYKATISLNSNSHVEVESGDIIGYYHPSDTKRHIWSIQTSGYTSYSSDATTGSLTSMDIDDVDYTEPNSQPLIKVTLSKIEHTYNNILCA